MPISSYVRVLRKRWRTVAVIAFATLLIAVVGTELMPKTYRLGLTLR